MIKSSIVVADSKTEVTDHIIKREDDTNRFVRDFGGLEDKRLSKKIDEILKKIELMTEDFEFSTTRVLLIIMFMLILLFLSGQTYDLFDNLGNFRSEKRQLVSHYKSLGGDLQVFSKKRNKTFPNGSGGLQNMMVNKDVDFQTRQTIRVIELSNQIGDIFDSQRKEIFQNIQNYEKKEEDISKLLSRNKFILLFLFFAFPAFYKFFVNSLQIRRSKRLEQLLEIENTEIKSFNACLKINLDFDEVTLRYLGNEFDEEAGQGHSFIEEELPLSASSLDKKSKESAEVKQNDLIHELTKVKIPSSSSKLSTNNKRKSTQGHTANSSSSSESDSNIDPRNHQNKPTPQLGYYNSQQAQAQRQGQPLYPQNGPIMMNNGMMTGQIHHQQPHHPSYLSYGQNLQNGFMGQLPPHAHRPYYYNQPLPPYAMAPGMNTYPQAQRLNPVNQGAGIGNNNLHQNIQLRAQNENVGNPGMKKFREDDSSSDSSSGDDSTSQSDDSVFSLQSMTSEYSRTASASRLDKRATRSVFGFEKNANIGYDRLSQALR